MVKHFKQQGHLTRHYNDVHKKLLQFACPECPQLFAQKETLDRHLERGKHTFYITCEYCKQDIEFKSDSEMYRHFIKDGKGRWSGRKKNTCVNEMKMRETDPDYDKSECHVCKEIFPSRIRNHWIRFDPEQPSKETCVTLLKRRPFLICPCCGDKLSTSDWEKHYEDPVYSVTDCKTRLAWRKKGDMIRGWGPLLIKGILVPCRTGDAPLDHPCHKKFDNPLNPCLPLPCWTPKYLRFILGNPLHFKPVQKD